MNSGKQRRAQIKAARTARIERRRMLETVARHEQMVARGAPVNAAALRPFNSYGQPGFLERGFYVDEPFVCAGCGSHEVWRATQQKWWYEVAKGDVYSTAKHCRACRRREQARRAGARRVHLEGLAKRGR